MAPFNQLLHLLLLLLPPFFGNDCYWRLCLDDADQLLVRLHGLSHGLPLPATGRMVPLEPYSGRLKVFMHDCADV